MFLPGPARAADLTLSVAISLKDAIEEVGARFEAVHPRTRPRYNLGGSGELARQIEAGAPVDVYISAGTTDMERLARAGLVLADSRRVVARNVLSVVVPARASPLSTPAALADRRVERVAIGDPRTVPAGQYARESLQSLGLWERLAPKLVLAVNVRQALEWVARGEVDAAFVYATDAGLRGARVREAFRVPPHSHSPIVYPAAVVAASREPALARALVDLLAGADGQAILGRHGFLPVHAR